MKVLESCFKFKILSDRFIGVYFDKTKQKVKEEDEIYNENYWQIYDAKSCVVYPDKFVSLLGFSEGVGVVEGFDEKYKYIKIEDGKFKHMKIKSDCINILKSYKNASLLVNNIGVVENKDGSMGYVLYKNNEIIELPEKYTKCSVPIENYGVVEDEFGYKSYVYITDDGVKPIGQKFFDCKDVKEGVARVRGCSFDSSKESNNRWHYALMDCDKINVLHDSFVNCYPIKDGIGRVVNDDGSMNYVKIANNEVVDISKTYKDCFEFNEGVCRVRHHDNTFSLFRIDEDGKFKPVWTREYSSSSDKTYIKTYFPKCEDIQNNTSVIVNKDKESVSYATYENGELDIKAQQFKNANFLKDNVGKVEYQHGYYGYVYNDNGTIIDLGAKYSYCKDFSEGFGIVGKNDKQCYVKIVSKNDPKNKYKLIEMLDKNGKPKEFISCESYKNGFGIVQTAPGIFAIIDKKGMLLEEEKFPTRKISLSPKKFETKQTYVKSISDLKKEHQAKRDRIHDTFFSR